MLDAQSDLRLSDAHRRRPVPPVGLGVHGQHDDGVHERLHQPVHLRCQVPRVPDGHETRAAQTRSVGSLACGDGGR